MLANELPAAAAFWSRTSHDKQTVKPCTRTHIYYNSYILYVCVCLRLMFRANFLCQHQCRCPYSQLNDDGDDDNEWSVGFRTAITTITTKITTNQRQLLTSCVLYALGDKCFCNNNNNNAILMSTINHLLGYLNVTGGTLPRWHWHISLPLSYTHRGHLALGCCLLSACPNSTDKTLNTQPPQTIEITQTTQIRLNPLQCQLNTVIAYNRAAYRPTNIISLICRQLHLC